MLKLWLASPGRSLAVADTENREPQKTEPQDDLETWLPLPGQPGYERSDKGNTRSIRKFHAIRAMHARGASVESIARECEIYPRTVLNIVTRCWRPGKEPNMKMKVTLPSVYTWESQARQYAVSGTPGIGYERHYANRHDRPQRGHAVDCLLMRDTHGGLVGILNHYPENAPRGLEKAGNVNIWVHPKLQRRGIASALVTEANKRWKLNAEQQRYTTEGLAFIQALLKSRRNHAV